MKINFNRKNLNIISFLVSLIIFSIILIIIYIISNQKLNQNYFYKMPSSEINNTNTEPILSNEFENKQNVNGMVANNENDISINEITNWQIEIEKLNLKTNIAEGANDEVIQNNVGHYTSSNILNGIIALKAYNSGQRNNYFANLKELQVGDEIKYIVNDKPKTYKVVSNKIIECNEELDETNEFTKICSYINALKINNSKGNVTIAQDNTSSQNDILILITYVKDLPNNLRCVVAEKN